MTSLFMFTIYNAIRDRGLLHFQGKKCNINVIILLVISNTPLHQLIAKLAAQDNIIMKTYLQNIYVFCLF